MDLRRCGRADVDALATFLDGADLTLSGLASPSLRSWVERDEAGAIVGSTGYEVSPDGRHALIRSVAVSPAHRGQGRGIALATFALDQATAEGAARAWLFSRRSGPFWQRLGFEPADPADLVEALANAEQVRLFRLTGQLAREVAWSRALPTT